jgi:hypothetical protein
VQVASANQATLFEITGGGTALNPTLDNYDVSLVSGYNIPIKVTPDIPIDTPIWHADTPYNPSGEAQSVITQKAKANGHGHTFLFNDVGDTPGESGQTKPKFPSTRFAMVADGNATWSNSGPTCETEGCTSDLLRTCPSGLQVLGPDNKTVIACAAPANLATASAANLSYYECKNNQGSLDLFSHPAVFQSPNAGSPICFSDQDCQPGTSCVITRRLPMRQIPRGRRAWVSATRSFRLTAAPRTATLARHFQTSTIPATRFRPQAETASFACRQPPPAPANWLRTQTIGA